MYDRRKIRTLIVSAIVFVGIIIAFSAVILTHRSGKIGVTITTNPTDATVTLDNSTIIDKKTYIAPGKHVFTATKDGFKDESATIDVSESRNTVTLILDPSSNGAEKWASDNSKEREALGDQAADERGVSLSSLNPLMNKLPYIDIAGPFAIDYGYDEKDNTKVYYLIHDTTPSGRVRAIEWIRNQGYDPTTLDIRFSDYASPLNSEGAAS